MQVCYFCATPLHILHAVTLKRTLHQQAAGDLVVYNHFTDAPRMVQVLSGLGLFRRVALYDNHTKTLAGKCHRLWHSLVPDPLIKPWKTAFPYDAAVFFALDPLTMSWLMKWGDTCTFYYGEDGIGSYINPTLYEASRVSAMVLRLTGRWRYLSRVAGIYLHQPTLRVTNGHLAAFPMPPLPLEDPEMTRVLEALWPIDEKTIDTARPVMYFGEPLRELFGVEALGLERQALTLLQESIGPDKLYIKRHPRMAEGPWSAALELACVAPYERVMGLWNQRHTMLVSVISTAALQPLLLTGQRPVMIFLYRLMLPENHPTRELWDAFFNRLECCYALGERLLLPASLPELKAALARWPELIGDKHGNETGNTKK